MHDDAGALQAFDGFVEKNVGVLIVGQQGLRPRQNTQAPIRSACARALFEPLHGLLGDLLLADACRSFNQFDQTPTVEAAILVFTRLVRGGEGLLVTAEPVVEDGGEAPGGTEHTTFAPRPPVGDSCFDQAGRVSRNPSPDSKGQ